jgi:rRNA-processing protein FCF1
MDIIVRFEQPMSKSEFLNSYEKINHKLPIQILTSNNVNQLSVHFDILKRYVQCYKLNTNQKYVLCKHLFYISKFIKNDLEMKKVFYSKLNFFVKHIQDENDVYNLRFWIYRICLNILVHETELELYNQMLLICTEFFLDQSSEMILLCLEYTFSDERFLHSMIKMYKKYNTSLLWEYTGFLLLDFIHPLVFFIAHNIDDFEEINIKFSHKYIKFLFLLLNENELDIWSMSFFQMSIMSHWLTDYKHCETVFTEAHIHKVISFISHIEQDKQKCQIAQLFLQTINNITNYNVIVDINIIEYIFKFMLSLNYSLDDFLIDELLIFITLTCRKYILTDSQLIAKIVSFTNDIVYNYNNVANLSTSLLSAITILLAKKHIGNDKVLFQTIYDNGLIYSLDDESGLRFICLMLIWLTLDFKHNWNLNQIVKNDISILDNGTEPNLIHHIKANLVYTSLYDKCKFKIQENRNFYSNNELEIFNYFLK